MLHDILNEALLKWADLTNGAENPWNKLRLGVVAFLTKTAFNDLRKQLGLPKFTATDWNRLENDKPLW